MTGQIRYVDVGKNQNPTVVHDPLEIVRSSSVVPANPTIPSFDPPGWAGKLKTPNNPRLRSADFDEIAQVRSKWDLVPKVMMSGYELFPLFALISIDNPLQYDRGHFSNTPGLQRRWGFRNPIISER